mgnify:CR=1 FL=1
MKALPFDYANIHGIRFQFIQKVLYEIYVEDNSGSWMSTGIKADNINDCLRMIADFKETDRLKILAKERVLL